MQPSYIDLYKKGLLQKRAKEAAILLENCTLCPGNCKAERLRLPFNPGACRTGKFAKIASFSPHFGEERPLVGKHGSGTIFFSSCNLMCCFCQNYDISHYCEGYEVSANQLASIMINLQKQGCHNINFVTPSHVVPQILNGLVKAVSQGLNIPLVYNSGGYDKPETLKLLDKVIDIYMPDFKFWNSNTSAEYTEVKDYSEIAQKAIKEMHNQVGDLIINSRGIAEKGLLVRHLVMPHNEAGTKGIMEFIAQEISADTFVNIMNQYYPCYRAKHFQKINTKITKKEFEDAYYYAKRAGIKNFL
jgi:putative pyruvate formate lyase activating enzyme